MENLTDTDSSTNDLYISLIASLSPEERAERMNRLCALGKLLSLEGLRESNPNLSEFELKLLLAKNLWGDPFANHLREKFGNDGK